MGVQAWLRRGDGRVYLNSIQVSKKKEGRVVCLTTDSTVLMVKLPHMDNSLDTKMLLRSVSTLASCFLHCLGLLTLTLI